VEFFVVAVATAAGAGVLFVDVVLAVVILDAATNSTGFSLVSGWKDLRSGSVSSLQSCIPIQIPKNKNKKLVNVVIDIILLLLTPS
jgi:hypothetical protein